MLRVVSRASQRVSQIQAKRFAHGVHYGAPEPLTPYLKYTAIAGAFVGLVTYDRFYSDRKISRWISPASDNAQEIEQQRAKFADQQVKEQDRNIELLFPRPRQPYLGIFSPSPVPGGSRRDQHTGEIQAVGERRPRA